MMFETTKFQKELKKLQKEKVFDYLNKEENKQLVEKELEQLNIKNLYLMDELGEDWEKAIETKTLGLVVLPSNNCVDENAEATKAFLKLKNIPNKDDYYSIDMLEYGNNKSIKEDIVYYYPDKNLLVCGINPFADQTAWELTLNAIKKIKPKFRTEQEICFVKISEQLKKGITNKLKDTENRYKTYDNNIQNIADNYKRTIREKEETRITIEAIKNTLKNTEDTLTTELARLQTLPIIKKLSFENGKIHISFGKVYITDSVVSKTIKKDGLEYPVTEKKKVYIGNLIFHIDDHVSVTNENNVEGHQHPHADNGNLCFGEEGLRVEDMLASFQLTKLVQFLYAWAHSYNKESAYMPLQDFYDENGAE